MAYTSERYMMMDERPKEEADGVGEESPLEILDKVCEQMKDLLTSAETLLQPEAEESVPDVPDVEQA